MEEHKDTGIAQSEGEAMRQHQVIKWLLIIIVIQAVLFVGSWAGFIWYNAQFETVTTTTVEQDSDTGSNNYVGNDGDIINGTPKGN